MHKLHCRTRWHFWYFITDLVHLIIEIFQDLSYEKMSDICVEKDEEFHEKTLTYRSFLSDVVKELAVNLPLNELWFRSNN